MILCRHYPKLGARSRGRAAGDAAGPEEHGPGWGPRAVSGERGLRRVSLEPVEFPRPWWRRHRYWLASWTPLVGTRAIIINMRTGEVHDWSFRGNRRGRGWFG